MSEEERTRLLRVAVNNEIPVEEARSFLYAAQPEVERKVYVTRETPDTSFPVISDRDASALYDIRCELEEARGAYPPFRSLASAVVEIHRRSDMVGEELVKSCGTMSLGVKRKLKQTAAMCLRALTENG